MAGIPSTDELVSLGQALCVRHRWGRRLWFNPLHDEVTRWTIDLKIFSSDPGIPAWQIADHSSWGSTASGAGLL